MSSQTYSNSIESSKPSGFDHSTLEKAISTIMTEHGQDAPETKFLQSFRDRMNQPDILQKERSTEEHMRWSFTKRFLEEQLPWKDTDPIDDERLKLLAVVVAETQKDLMGLSPGTKDVEQGSKDTIRYDHWLRGTDGERIPGLSPFISLLYELYLNR
jgi:hypothetical protein